jgi:Uncharacterized conserved protein
LGSVMAATEYTAWYVQNYGPEVNLFIDHSQIVQLEFLRSGIWGPTTSLGACTPSRDVTEMSSSLRFRIFPI